MYRYRTYIEGLVREGGPAAEASAGFDAALDTIARLKIEGRCAASDIEVLRSWFGDALSPATLQGLTYRQSCGGAADCELYDRIYTGRLSDDPRFANWDRYFQNRPVIGALRRRKDYFQKLLDRHHARRSPLRVLKIDGGPGRASHEWFCANPSAAVEIHCVETCREAIARASALNAKHLDRIRFTHDEPLLFDGVGGPYDLIWAVGLFDRMEDSLCVRMLRRLFPALSRGGELVAGNLMPGEEHYLELVSDWRIHRRDRVRLYSLAASATLPYSHIAAVEEPEGVNLFLHLGR